MKILAGFAALSLVVPATASFAQGNNGIVGSIGLTLGVTNIKEVDGGTFVDNETLGFGILNGEVSIPVGQNFLLGFDAYYRYDNFSSTGDFNSGEDPQSEMTATIRALYNFNPGTRAGVFVNYGAQSRQDGNNGNAYDYYLVGVEGQTFISDDILVYGQAAIGDKVSDGQDDREGFNDGLVLRVGSTYFLNDRTALIFDFEYAGVENYVDNNDPGRFFGVSFGGETRLKTSAPLFLNYGLSYTYLSSTDESESNDEIALSVGLKYVFGADTPRERWTNGIGYGGPRLPVRASAWTEYFD